MPKNPNPTLTNRHCLYLGKSGSGKSQALLQSKEIPLSGVRTMLFDPANDQAHAGTHYEKDRAVYARKLAQAVKSGQGFRLAYNGERSVDIFEWWCQLAWAIADGNKPLYLEVEELARVCPNPAEATPFHNKLLSEGRKYGIVYHATSQRPQEISKTVFHEVERFVIGQQARDNIKKMAGVVDCPVAVVEALEPLQFVTNQSDSGARYRQFSLNYKKIKKS